MDKEAKSLLTALEIAFVPQAFQSVVTGCDFPKSVGLAAYEFGGKRGRFRFHPEQMVATFTEFAWIGLFIATREPIWAGLYFVNRAINYSMHSQEYE